MRIRTLLIFLISILLFSCNEEEELFPIESAPPPRDVIEDPVIVNECDKIIMDNFSMGHDFNCADSIEHAAFRIGPSDVVFDGKGRSIQLSEHNKIGLYIESENVIIKNLTILGRPDQIGILAHNSINLTLDNVQIKGLYEGVVYSADDDFACGEFNIQESSLSNNELHGVRVTAFHCAAVSFLANNEFLSNGSYGANINGKVFSIGQGNNNKFNLSANGIKIRVKQEASINGLEMNQSEIFGENLTLISSKKIKVQNSSFGGTFLGLSLHAYDIEDLSIKNSSFLTEKFAIKVANETKNTKLVVKGNTFSPQDIAAILLTSYSQEDFVSITIKNNDFTNNVLPLADYANSLSRDIQ